MTNTIEIIKDRTGQFAEIVSLIQQTRTHVIRLANTALIDLYWNIGQYISEKLAASDWGDGVVKQLADYIAKNAPEAKGFSDKNLWRMKQFYETYKGAGEKLSALLREIAPQAEHVFRDQYVLEFLSRSLSPTMVTEYQLYLPDKALLQQKLHEIYEQKSRTRQRLKLFLAERNNFYYKISCYIKKSVVHLHRI